MVIEKCADWQLSSALHMIFQAQEIGPGEWQEGHGRPNFNPFLTGHHGIHRRRSQIIFHIKYFMLEKMRKKGSMDDKCDDQNLRGGGQHHLEQRHSGSNPSNNEINRFCLIITIPGNFGLSNLQICECVSKNFEVLQKFRDF